MSALSFSYRDPDDGTPGFVVIDQQVQGSCGGPLLCGPRVDAAQVQRLARATTARHRAASIAVGGGAIGLATDPGAAQFEAIMGRFFVAMASILRHCFIATPGPGLDAVTLDTFAKRAGIPSPAISLVHTHGIKPDVVLSRTGLLRASVRDHTCADLACGTAVAAAAMAAWSRRAAPRVAVIGTGRVGRATVRDLIRRGAQVVVWSDAHVMAEHGRGLPAAGLNLQGPIDLRALGPVRSASEALATPVDILILTGGRRLLTAHLPRVRAQVVVEAAAEQLSRRVHLALERRGIAVVPDLIAGTGDAWAIEALATSIPTHPDQILGHVARRAASMTRQLLEERRGHRLGAHDVISRWLSAGGRVAA